MQKSIKINGKHKRRPKQAEIHKLFLLGTPNIVEI